MKMKTERGVNFAMVRNRLYQKFQNQEIYLFFLISQLSKTSLDREGSIQPSQSIVMYCCWPTLVVLDAAQEALAQALIEHKDDLRGDLRTQEGRLLHSVAGVCRSGSAWAAGSTTTSGVAPASPCGTGCVAVAALILPLREVLGRFKSLDRRWGL